MLHLNEGHSGFAVFEAIRDRMVEEGLDFYTAASQIPREVIFTTHTPVPAGHDRFDPDLIEEHLGPLREQLGISHDNLMGFGREHPDGLRRAFLHDRAWAETGAASECGFVAARRGLARHVEEPVSGPAGRRGADWPHHEWRACAVVARSADVPAVRSAPWSGLADSRARSKHTWEEIENVDDGELWETHLSLKAQLLDFARRRAKEQAERRGESARDAAAARQGAFAGCADDRLCAAVCHLQAREPAAGGHGAAGLDGERSQAAGAVSLCRQGASARRAGQAGSAADCAR